MGLCSVTGAIGNSLAAGAAGTAAMTVSSTIEMTLRGREPTTTRAQAAAKVLRVEPSEVQRVATIVHWGYGTVWGAELGLVPGASIRRLFEELSQGNLGSRAWRAASSMAGGRAVREVRQHGPGDRRVVAGDVGLRDP